MTDIEQRIPRFLKGESGKEEQRQMEKWLQDPANRQEFEKFKEIWEASGEVYKDYTPNVGKAWENIEQRILRSEDVSSPSSIDLWKWIGRAAAILVFATGIGWLAMQWFQEPDHNFYASLMEVSTASGIDSVALSDGSIIWLNRNTTIQFPETFGTKERRIILRGEAFFEVERDTERPFIVEAQGTVTRVLGTSFNINARVSEASVSVFTGKVSFSEDKDPANEVILTKGEKAQINPVNNHINKFAVDPNALAWKTGVLVFQNTPLQEVAIVLSAHYNQSVTLENTDSLSLTTSFEKQSLEEVLDVISITLDIRYEKVLEGYILK
ncbi:FecR domain-containing protein [Fulvivirga kasyanovii]|uniref:DUF4974 domain-containing protein n=1 Tax=Fulvivirga kasyanovii TaxID=396812 RepID=A0ABW9RKG5_9BACT|nr:DUF4974 domain-containing protein [Fulvivirga kasyanovii]